MFMKANVLITIIGNREQLAPSQFIQAPEESLGGAPGGVFFFDKFSARISFRVHGAENGTRHGSGIIGGDVLRKFAQYFPKDRQFADDDRSPSCQCFERGESETSAVERNTNALAAS